MKEMHNYHTIKKSAEISVAQIGRSVFPELSRKQFCRAATKLIAGLDNFLQIGDLVPSKKLPQGTKCRREKKKRTSKSKKNNKCLVRNHSISTRRQVSAAEN